MFIIREVGMCLLGCFYCFVEIIYKLVGWDKMILIVFVSREFISLIFIGFNGLVKIVFFYIGIIECLIDVKVLWVFNFFY